MVSSISIPCHILSTNMDDYIKEEHAIAIQEEWAGPCTLKKITGNQFSSRTTTDVLSATDMIKHHLRINKVL